MTVWPSALCTAVKLSLPIWIGHRINQVGIGMPPENKMIRRDAQTLLRVEAEEQLANSSPIATKARVSKELLHEFQVQQIELEIQNEELRRAHTALEESRDRYIDLYDFSPNGYLTLSCDGLINEINLTGATLLGEERNKLVGRRFALFVTPEDSDLWHQHILRAKNKNAKQSCELTLKRKDGSVFYVKLDSLRMPASHACSIRVVISDITERNRMEREIQERRKEMEDLHMLHAASQTVASIAHELNQPLLAIASYSSAALMLLKCAEPDLDKVRKAIDGCERQAHRAGKSIRDLLEFLNVQEFSTEIFDLNKEIREVLDVARQEHELEFESVFQIEDGLPLVRASRSHVQKVLFNLLHNGVEAIRDGGVLQPVISVTVSKNPDESVAEVTIQDNGPGVKEEDQHRLFKPFFTTKAKGIGMGLAVSRSLVEANGGRLWLEPQAGSGAIFHLTLPFAS